MIDLQKKVHEDKSANFDKYHNNWGLTRTDRNIYHRRVPNQMVFLERNGTKLPVTNKAEDYTPGDIVCWNLVAGVTHTEFVVNKKSRNNKRYLIVHNIGAGQVI